MNPLQSIDEFKDYLKDDIEDIVNHAKALEAQLQKFGPQLDSYQQQANDFIDDLVNKVPELVEFKGLQTMLDNSPVYQKLKDQDLSGLFTIPDDFDSSDFQQIEALAAQKAEWLKTFLAPLELKNLDAIFSGIQEIVTDLMQIPEELDFSNPNIVEAFRQSKVNQIRPKMMRVMELILGIPLQEQPPTNTEQQELTPPPSSIEQKLMDQLEDILPQLQQEIQAVNQQEPKVELAVDTIKNLLPIVNKLLSSFAEGATVDTSKIEPFLDDFSAQLKTIDTSTMLTAIDGGMKILANLGQKYLPADGPLAELNALIQKIQGLVSKVKESGLLVPIKFHHMADDETLPKTKGINLNRKWTPASDQNPVSSTFENTATAQSASSALDQPQASGTSGNTTNANDTSINVDQSLLEVLIKDALRKLPQPDQDFVARLIDGRALSFIRESIQDLELKTTPILKNYFSQILKKATLEYITQTITISIRNIIHQTIELLRMTSKKTIELLSSISSLIVQLLLKLFNSIPVGVT